MLLIVCLIAFLVHVFSLGYMNDEGERASRATTPVSACSPPPCSGSSSPTTCSWRSCSSSWWVCARTCSSASGSATRPAVAAKKAFLVTRFGDYFFLIGVVGVFATFGTVVRLDSAGRRSGRWSFPMLAEHALVDGELEGIACWTRSACAHRPGSPCVGLLVLGGVVGKSAQFPLHTWLPDAMEGPTPVSALIHAATMVAAGVYLVARMYGFYARSPTALAVIALIGGFTALFAATMGVVKREIKQVLAYSTISQYGYMMLGLGAGGYVAATFHLMTHAFFKALLFLGAGSVIIAMHHNENMWDMGGLKDRMPVTYYTFLSGSLALAGIFPFAGFWSKDEVLYETLIHGLGGSPILLVAYAMGLLAVFFTGFYTFRMVFLTFHGKPLRRRPVTRAPSAGTSRDR